MPDLSFDPGRIVDEANWCINHQSGIVYDEIRPIQGLGRRHQLPIHIDCSGFVTVCYNWAGAPDPNGNNYSGQGYTGTLVTHGRSTTQSAARPADIVVFGDGVGVHVALVLESGSNPMLANHGGEPEPRRTDFHSLWTYFNSRGHGTTRWRTFAHGNLRDPQSDVVLPDNTAGLGNPAV
jgi:hypothetical protein